MKRILTTIALAAPLATVALSLGATSAMAEPAGPASDQITSTKPGPVNPHLPEDPEEQNPPIDPDPEPEPDPDGSDVPDEKIPPPSPCSTPDDEPSDEPEEDPLPQIRVEKDPGDEDEDEPGDKLDIPRPNCIDAGAASNDGGMELAWLIAGGGLITATGAAYAVRRRSSMGA